jgi:predicted nicotinamide N-methyase
VLELGAGGALPGIVSALLGARKVRRHSLLNLDMVYFLLCVIL